MRDIVALRTKAYGRREGIDNLVPAIREADPWDRFSSLLIARDKATGECVGTIRLHISSLGATPAPPQMPLEWLGSDSFL